jgi:HAD superfamily hydrolase (TIGR01509 family)
VIELVIFDNDGVVVDSELLANRVLADLLGEHGYPATVEECIRDFMGGTLDGVRTIVLQRSGVDLGGDFGVSYHQRLFECFEVDLRPVPGIELVLDALTLPYGLASSGTRQRIERSLALTGLRRYFGDRIFSADEVELGKPAPDLFLHVAAVLDVAPSRCVVVEDSPNGVAAARAAGMCVVGFSSLTPVERLADAHATFSDMAGLLALLVALR